jgi:hypothetical protein
MTMAKATKVSTPEPELPSGNRYCRIARILIANGTDDIDFDDLAKQAEMSTSACRYGVEAFLGIHQAMIEAGWLKAPPAEKAETAEELAQ